MHLTSRQVIALIVSLCVAVVFLPVAVLGATGELANIVDPFNGARKARVSDSGGLVVSNRAHVGRAAFNAATSRQGLGWAQLASAVGPTRIAITEMTLTGSFDPHPGTAEVAIEAFVRRSGNEPCKGPGTAGYERRELRRVMVNSRSTLELDFSGQPLVVPAAASGQPICFGTFTWTISNGLKVYTAANGYKYRN